MRGASAQAPPASERRHTAASYRPAAARRRFRAARRCAPYGAGSVELDLSCSQYFEVDPDVLEAYGAFDISVVSGLPLFVDPFLLFNNGTPSISSSTRRSWTTCSSSATGLPR